MKFQHVSVMFIVIFIPIILVTSYFISLQVNTIRLESSYDEKLLNATYDAMTAFELNTANEDLSSVSDSLRSIIDASNNIFFNTLCTNLGISNASKSFVQPYIPAILYTLYDGYYIYSPTNIPEICVDKYGRTITTKDYGVKLDKILTYTEGGKSYKVGIYIFNQDSIKYSDTTHNEPVGLNSGYNDYNVEYSTMDSSLKEEYGQILYKNNNGTYSTSLHTVASNYDESTYYKRDYILKSYIPYSATYHKDADGSNPAIDITINYTLDNFMTIEGTIGNVYYTKSGYLIDQNLVKSIVVDGTTFDNSDVNSWKRYSEETLKSYIYDPQHHEVKVNLDEIVYTSYGTTVTSSLSISNQDGKVEVSNGTGSGSEVRYWNDAQSAVEYYVDSYIFSKWVYTNLSGLQASTLKSTPYSVSDIQNTATQNLTDQTTLYKDMLHNFDGDNSLPFEGNNNNPESDESPFYEHKRHVIKNSITYNLVLSMIVYTEESRTTEFNMPVFSEEEWNRILNNVSIVSFMEGMRCGLKYYNNYAIVTSTNNEISVTDNEIYYVPRILQEIDASTGAKIVSALDDDYVNEIAHRVDCEELKLGDSTNNFYTSSEGWTSWLGCNSFKSKEIKYDKILDSEGRYVYDHKVYTDYDCIVDSNYTVRNVNGTKEDGNTDVADYLIKNVTYISPTDTALRDDLKYKLLAYRIAIAKERNNLYKTTAFPENYGWQVVYLGDVSSGVKLTSGSANVSLSNLPSNRKISEIKKIEVTIEGAKQKKAGVYTSEISAKYNDGSEYSTKQTVSTTSSNRRTIEFVQDFNSDAQPTSITISANDIEFTIEAVKVYYK